MAILSSDRPSIDPKQDLFGHAPFAEALAKSIHSYPDADGVVLALYGPWGSGKSTVLAYVLHYLQYQAEKEPPVIVTLIRVVEELTQPALLVTVNTTVLVPEVL